MEIRAKSSPWGKQSPHHPRMPPNHLAKQQAVNHPRKGIWYWYAQCLRRKRLMLISVLMWINLTVYTVQPECIDIPASSLKAFRLISSAISQSPALPLHVHKQASGSQGTGLGPSEIVSYLITWCLAPQPEWSLKVGAPTVVVWAKLSPTVPASHMGTNLSPICSVSHPASC